MGTRPKMLVLATTFPAEVTDGTPSFVLDVCRELTKHFDLLVICPKSHGLQGEDSIDGVRVWRFGGKWPFSSSLSRGSILDNLKKNPLFFVQLPFFLLAFVHAARRGVRRFRPDLLHAHWVIPGGVVSRLVFSGPRVVTAHGGDLYALSGPLATWWKRWALRNSRVSVVNTEMVSIARSLGVTSEIPVIPSGPVQVKPDRQAKVPGQVVFVGRLVEKKGLEFLVRAVTGLPCRLHILGDGPLRDELQSLAAPNTVFHGQRGKAEVMKMIASSELMVIPSVVGANGDQEGMPLTLMEATAARVAVIATDLPGIQEVIAHGVSGLIVPQRDEDALRTAIERLLADSDLRQSLAGELEKQSSRFSVETVSRRYLNLLLECIEPPR